MVADHADVDTGIFLGMGIQSNQANLMRSGPFYPDERLERVVAFHERQDPRFTHVIVEGERSGNGIPS